MYIFCYVNQGTIYKLCENSGNFFSNAVQTLNYEFFYFLWL